MEVAEEWPITLVKSYNVNRYTGIWMLNMKILLWFHEMVMIKTAQ